MKVSTTIAFTLLFAGLVHASCIGLYAYSQADENRPYNAGESTTLTCSDGYQYGTNVFSASVTCDGTNWIEGGSTVRADCSPIPNYCSLSFLNAQLQNPSAQSIGSTATLDCNSGYRATVSSNPSGFDSLTVTCVKPESGATQGPGAGRWAVYNVAAGTSDFTVTCSLIPDFCPTEIKDASTYQRLVIDFTDTNNFNVNNLKRAYCGPGFVTPFSAPSVTIPTSAGDNSRPPTLETDRDVRCLDDGNVATNKNRAGGGAWYFESNQTAKATCVKVQGYCNENNPIPSLDGNPIFFGTPSQVVANSPGSLLDGNPSGGPEGFALCPRGYGLIPSDRRSGIPISTTSGIQCYPGTDIQGEWWIETAGGAQRAYCQKLDNYCLDPDTVNTNVPEYHFRNTLSDSQRRVASSVSNERIQVDCDAGYEFTGQWNFYGDATKTKGFVFCRPDSTGQNYISNANYLDFTYGIFVDSVSNPDIGTCTAIDYYCPPTQGYPWNSPTNGNALYDGPNFVTAALLGPSANVHYGDVAYIDCPVGTSADGTKGASALQATCFDLDLNFGSSNFGNTWHGTWKSVGSPVPSSCQLIRDFCPAPTANMQFFAVRPYHNTPTSTDGTTVGFNKVTNVNPWSQWEPWSYWTTTRGKGTGGIFSVPVGGLATTNSFGATWGTGWISRHYFGTSFNFGTRNPILNINNGNVDTVFDNRGSYLYVFTDDMESGSSNWVTGVISQGTDDWTITNAFAHSPSHSWFASTPASGADKFLTNANPISLNSGAILSFWHKYGFQDAGYDGAVLEISTDAGTTWNDLEANITYGGYNFVLHSCCGIPIPGRRAWSGNTGWTRVQVDLSSFSGQNVNIRWRSTATTDGFDGTGWYIDDIKITNDGGSGSISVPTLTASIRGTQAWAVCDDGYGFVKTTQYWQAGPNAHDNIAREIRCLNDPSQDDPSIGNTGQHGKWVQQSNGASLGTCSKLDNYCNPADQVSFGSWAPGTSFPIGGSNTFYCSPGYSQTTSNTASAKTFTVTCTDPFTGSTNVGDAVGVWNVPPQCNKITVYCPNTISNSDFTPSGQWAIDDTKSILCNSGYTLTGVQAGLNNYLATCVADNDANIFNPPTSGTVTGKWVYIDTATNSRTDAKCLPAAGICQQTIGSQTSFNALTFNVTSTGTLVCNEGYGIQTLSYNPTSSLYCEAIQVSPTETYGQWVINPPATPTVPLSGSGQLGTQTCDHNPSYCPGSLTISNSDSVNLPATGSVFYQSTGQVTCSLGYGNQASFTRIYPLDCSVGTGSYPTHGQWTLSGSTSFNCQQIPDYCSSLTQFETTPHSSFSSGASTGIGFYTDTRTLSCDDGFRFNVGGSKDNDLGTAISTGVFSNADTIVDCVDNAVTSTPSNPTADAGYWTEKQPQLGYPPLRDVLSSASTGPICRPVDLCNGFQYFSNALNVPTIVSGNTISGFTASSRFFFVDAIATVTCINGYMPQSSSADTFWTNPTPFPASGAFDVQCRVTTPTTTCAGGFSNCYGWTFALPNTNTAVPQNVCVRSNNYCPVNFVAASVFGSVQRTESLEFGTLASGTVAFVNSQSSIQCNPGYQASTFNQYKAGTTSPDPTGSALFNTLVTTASVSCKPDVTPDAAGVPPPIYMVNYLGDWKYNDIPFACVPIPQYCKDPSIPFNQGSIQLPSSYSRAVGESTLSYCCDAGYIINGTAATKSVSVTCVPPANALTTYQTNYGIWVDQSGAVPACVKRSGYCPGSVANAVLSTTAQRQVGDLATVTCPTGYKIQGSTNAQSATFVCTASANNCNGVTQGTWNNASFGSAACEQILNYCPTPVAVGGTIGSVSNADHVFSSTYVLTCSDGYSVDGLTTGALSVTSTCQADRTWSAASCLIITNYCTDAAATLSNTATINLVNGYKIGDQLAFTCKNSYTVFGVNLTMGGVQSGALTCTFKAPVNSISIGAFTDASGTQPICQAQKGICPIALPFTTANAARGDQGDNATFTCQTGYSLDGTRTGAISNSVTCVLQIATQIGQWQNSLGQAVTKCIQIPDYCPATFSAASGSLTASTRTFNALSTFNCNNGYKFGTQFTESVRCVVDTSLVGSVGGKWVDATINTNTPQCNTFTGYCTTPAVGSTTPYQSISVASPALNVNSNFVCNSGYIFAGSASPTTTFTATCNAFNATNGALLSGGSPALCIKDNSYCTNTVSFGTVSSTALSVDTTGTLSCSAGYSGPTAAGALSCRPNPSNPLTGIWVETASGNAATCSIISGYCGSQKLGLTATLPVGSIGTSRLLQCDAGFQLSAGVFGVANEVCSAGGNWVDQSNSQNVGECSAIPNYCPTPANAVLSSVSNAALIVGTTADLTCATGYSFDGSNTVQTTTIACSGSGWLEGLLTPPPTCVQITQYCPSSFTLATAVGKSALGDAQNFTCSVGAFSPTNTSSGTITCTAAGTWDFGGSVFTGCSLGDICPTAPTVANSFNVTTTGTVINSNAVAVCNPGFGSFNGFSYDPQATATCTVTGWSVVTCDLIPVPTSASPTPIATTTTPTPAGPATSPSPSPSPAAPTTTPTPSTPPTSNPPTSSPPTSSPPTSSPPTSSPPTSSPPTSSTVDSGSMLVLSIALLAL